MGIAGWLVIAVYAGLMIGVGIWYSRQNQTADDYLLGATATGGATENICDADWSSSFEALAQLPGGAGEVRFPLAERPVASTLVVEVGGVSRSGWALDAATNELVFDSTAFTLGSEVDIHYVSAVACETGSS